jgi:hypothetical protein
MLHRCFGKERRGANDSSMLMVRDHMKLQSVLIDSTKIRDAFRELPMRADVGGLVNEKETRPNTRAARNKTWQGSLA